MAAKGTETKDRILDTAKGSAAGRGFAATSLDDIISATGLTKVRSSTTRSKADLARKLVERFAANDFQLFDDWERRAACCRRPVPGCRHLHKAVRGVAREHADALRGLPVRGLCLRERRFDADINALRTSLERWQDYHERMFAAVLAAPAKE
jgi:AcrR family transcriptional regulator